MAIRTLDFGNRAQELDEDALREMGIGPFIPSPEAVAECERIERQLRMGLFEARFMLVD